MSEQLNAWNDLQDTLLDGEEVEAVVFGDWGWSGYGGEEEFVPKNRRGIVLSPTEAKGYMVGWGFNGGYGAPECYAVYIWTNRRVIWVTQYDGSTCLDAAPRNPQDVEPIMPGG